MIRSLDVNITFWSLQFSTISNFALYSGWWQAFPPHPLPPLFRVRTIGFLFCVHYCSSCNRVEMLEWFGVLPCVTYARRDDVEMTGLVFKPGQKLGAIFRQMTRPSVMLTHSFVIPFNFWRIKFFFNLKKNLIFSIQKNSSETSKILFCFIPKKLSKWKKIFFYSKKIIKMKILLKEKSFFFKKKLLDK